MNEAELDLNVWICLLFFATQHHTEVEIIKVIPKTNAKIKIGTEAWRGSVSFLRGQRREGCKMDKRSWLTGRNHES